MFDVATAWDSVLKCDDSIQALMIVIRDRAIALATSGEKPPGDFPVDEYFQFVRAWNTFKSQVDRKEGAFFAPAETLDRVKIYWEKNVVWRNKAELDLGIPPLSVPEVQPAKPPPPNDPSRKLPYENVVYAGLGVAALYLVAKLFGKA
jgi:hypothetical protein